MALNRDIKITRVEPLSWWIGMNTPLQIMLYGENLENSKVEVKEIGVEVKKVINAESPDYIFLDVEISDDAIPGDYTFILRKGDEELEFLYSIQKRRDNSSLRESYNASDLIYLLMPDRFANGDPQNDSTQDTIEKADRNNPDGRHGGDLQGVIDHLDYIKDLGVTTLWLTPPQLDNENAISYHGYACGDYYHVDPRFGDNELYKNLVNKAHNLGLKVVMDAVPNHCGTNHWWMKNLPFTDWVHLNDGKKITSNYRLAAITDPNSAEINVKHTVDGWFDSTMPDMSIENPYVLQYLLQLYIWWIEWADLDGLRVDTFPYNDKYAIAEWTKKILEEYPNLNIVAECWHSSPNIVAYWHGKTKNNDGYCSHLPSVMDFPLQEAISGAFKKDSTEFQEGMNKLYEALALDFLYADPKELMIFLDNHDIERFADTMKGNKEKIKMGLTLLATLRGIPQLMYGTEYGFRSDDISKGHGAARKDFPGGWKDDRKNLFTGKRVNSKEKEIYEHTKKLFNWRKTSKAIHEGDTKHYLPRGNTYSFWRSLENEAVYVIVNPSSKAHTIEWEKYYECTDGYEIGTNIITGRKVTIGKTFTIAPKSSAVIEFFK